VGGVIKIRNLQLRSGKQKNEKVKNGHAQKNANGKQSGESVESVLKKKRKGCGGKDLQKRKVLSLE